MTLIIVPSCNRDLQDASFFDRRPGGDAPGEHGPAGPLAVKQPGLPARQQPGVNHLGEAWKGDTWRAPFKPPGTPGVLGHGTAGLTAWYAESTQGANRAVLNWSECVRV